jgi:hypothetical protein
MYEASTISTPWSSARKEADFSAREQSIHGSQIGSMQPRTRMGGQKTNRMYSNASMHVHTRSPASDGREQTLGSSRTIRLEMPSLNTSGASLRPSELLCATAGRVHTDIRGSSASDDELRCDKSGFCLCLCVLSNAFRIKLARS